MRRLSGFLPWSGLISNSEGEALYLYVGTCLLLVRTCGVWSKESATTCGVWSKESATTCGVWSKESATTCGVWSNWTCGVWSCKTHQNHRFLWKTTPAALSDPRAHAGGSGWMGGSPGRVRGLLGHPRASLAGVLAFADWNKPAGGAAVRLAHRSHVVVKGPGAPRAIPAPGAALRSDQQASSAQPRRLALLRPSRAAHRLTERRRG